MSQNSDEMTANTEQARKLKAAQDDLEMTGAQLADQLGVSHDTLRGWMSARNSTRWREMPRTAKLLLARILQDKRPGSRRRV